MRLLLVPVGSISEITQGGLEMFIKMVFLLTSLSLGAGCMALFAKRIEHPDASLYIILTISCVVLAFDVLGSILSGDRLE